MTRRRETGFRADNGMLCFAREQWSVLLQRGSATVLHRSHTPNALMRRPRPSGGLGRWTDCFQQCCCWGCGSNGPSEFRPLVVELPMVSAEFLHFSVTAWIFGHFVFDLARSSHLSLLRSSHLIVRVERRRSWSGEFRT